MLFETAVGRLRKARLVNETSSSFRDLLAIRASSISGADADAGTATGASIIRVGQGIVQNRIKVIPYGIGSNGNTFSFRVHGYWFLKADSVGEAMWKPQFLGEFLCTLDSGSPGVAGCAVLDTEYFCKTITQTYGNANVSNDVNSSTLTKLDGHVVLDLKAPELLQFSFSVGTATSGNALFCAY